MNKLSLNIRISIATGLIIFLPALYGWQVDTPWMINGNFDMISLTLLGLLPLIGGTVAALMIKSKSGGYLSFTKAMTSMITVIALSIGIYTLLFCLMFYVDHGFTETFSKTQYHLLEEKVRLHQMMQAELTKRDADMKNVSFTSAITSVAILSNTIFFAVPEIIISLLISTIIRKEK